MAIDDWRIAPQHENARSLLSRLLTPRRLQENSDYIWSLADRQLDEFIVPGSPAGQCEFLGEYGKPFATLAIADLLGVPEEDRPEIRRNLGAGNDAQRRRVHRSEREVLVEQRHQLRLG